jgi:tRNA wybutosine-synthesizing protein 1
MPEALVDEPDVIVEQLMAERKKLINGFYGNPRNDKAKLDESLLPAHYAISLSGEPTMYPKLPQLIRYLKSLKATKSIFLVTNGQEPDMLRRLEEEDALPTQIYLSTNASNKKMFHRINRPLHKDAWERWWDSLRFVSKVNTRTVLRMTLIRGYNDSADFVKEFSEMMAEGDPHFIELKSYMHIGMSTQRLEQEHMLEMSEVRNFAGLLCERMSCFEIMDESEISRIVVMQNKKRYVERWIKAYFRDESIPATI